MIKQEDLKLLKHKNNKISIHISKTKALYGMSINTSCAIIIIKDCAFCTTMKF